MTLKVRCHPELDEWVNLCLSVYGLRQAQTDILRQGQTDILRQAHHDISIIRQTDIKKCDTLKINLCMDSSGSP